MAQSQSPTKRYLAVYQVPSANSENDWRKKNNKNTIAILNSVVMLKY